jgi:hypothetical protein
MRFIVFRQRERPRYWAATDDWDVGDIFAEADTIPKLRERVLARLEEGRRFGWLKENYGFDVVPKPVFRRAVRADHRALDRNAEELDGLVERAMKALPEVLAENKELLDLLK